MLRDLSQFRHWDVVALCIAMAIVFVFEMMGVFTDKYITITYIVRSYMPKWATAMILGWMAYHFMLTPGR